MFVALLALVSLGWRTTKRESSTDRPDNAAGVLHEIMAAPDKGIPEVLEHAKWVAVVPQMIKAGFVFGAENGEASPHAGRQRKVTPRSVLLGKAAAPAATKSFLKAFRGAKAPAVAAK